MSFTIKATINKGTTSVVKLVEKIETGELYAIKLIKNDEAID